MNTLKQFYIGGAWVEPLDGATPLQRVDPVTEEPAGYLAMGASADADRAVSAARAAFPAWSATSRETRITLLERIAGIYQTRLEDMAQAVRKEIGAPITLARTLQAPLGLAHLNAAIDTLRNFAFSTDHGRSVVVREPIGVAALITPWNWPLNQIMAKVAPALAAGCTVVLKPSEIAPLDAIMLAEVMHEADTPPGVFNMIFGEGSVVGARLASHPSVDVVSITGSTRAGVEVAINAAPTVKRVTQELGGKSPLVILDDADLKTAVATGVMQCMMNAGQTCIAPTRMLVPAGLYEQAVAIAAGVANAIAVGNPDDPATKLGPISNRSHYEKVQRMIQTGIDEGARLVAGGPGRPQGIERGFFAKPTVFADVRNDMQIAREEIFGPVLSIIPYTSEAQAIEIANDTEYGLAAYVASGDPARAQRVAARLRAGTVLINGASFDLAAPFGGYKRSGNGREFGAAGLAEFLECKSITSA